VNAPLNTPAILLLENSDDDVFLFRNALLRLRACAMLVVVGTVKQARNYMENAAAGNDPARYTCPSLIVCDYGLDDETGADFVQWVKQQPGLTEVPVFFFTGTLPPSQHGHLSRRFAVPVYQKQFEFEDTIEVLKKILHQAGIEME
jgi:CheY-like chemotaxis protein